MSLQLLIVMSKIFQTTFFHLFDDTITEQKHDAKPFFPLNVWKREFQFSEIKKLIFIFYLASNGY